MRKDMDMAVVLLGGGSRCAFQVGVLDALQRETRLNVGLYAGISTGAIQALGAAQGRVDGLRAMWESLRGDQDVYEMRAFGRAGAFIFGRASLYDRSPLKRRIAEFHSEKAIRNSGIGFYAACTRLQDGRLAYLSEETDDILDWMMASDARPVTDQPVVDDEGGQWVAGGFGTATPLKGILARRPKSLLIVATKSRKLKAAGQKRSYRGALDIGLRGAEILSDEIIETDVQRIQRINALLAAVQAQERTLKRMDISDADRKAISHSLREFVEGYRYVPMAFIEPDAAYQLPDPSVFRSDYIRRLISHGEAVVGRPETRSAIDELKRKAAAA